MKRISPQELYQECCRDFNIWLVDVRSPAEFESLRAKPATNIPLDRLDPETLCRPSDCTGPLYLICQSGARAQMAAKKLEHNGETIVLVEGGTSAWSSAGLPVIKGERRVISIERQVRIIAGALVAAGAILSKVWHPDAIYLSGMVGLGVMGAGITDSCLMGMMLTRLPWNRS
jgi:rhodanese-related sulfurtransferase